MAIAQASQVGAPVNAVGEVVQRSTHPAAPTAGRGDRADVDGKLDGKIVQRKQCRALGMIRLPESLGGGGHDSCRRRPLVVLEAAQ
jgi:hypothetical protein